MLSDALVGISTDTFITHSRTSTTYVRMDRERFLMAAVQHDEPPGTRIKSQRSDLRKFGTADIHYVGIHGPKVDCNSVSKYVKLAILECCQHGVPFNAHDHGNILRYTA